MGHYELDPGRNYQGVGKSLGQTFTQSVQLHSPVKVKRLVIMMGLVIAVTGPIGSKRPFSL